MTTENIASKSSVPTGRAPGSQKLTDNEPLTRNDAHFFCGAGASAINIIVTFPINKIMFRQQLFGFRMNKAVKQITHEGFINLYRGLPAPLLQKSISTALMFGLYHQSYQKMTTEWNINEHLAMLYASFFAGACESTLTPFERAQVLLLTPKHHDTFKSTFHTMATLHNYSGLKEYYRGLSAIFIRNGFSNAIFFGLRKPIKTMLPHAEEKTIQNSLNDFISGAVIGALCSTMFYPINVVKTRMQSNVGGKFESLSKTFVIIYNERNKDWSKFFRGCHINIARSFISWGIINASFEMLMKTFYGKS
uniref:mitochondrial nicotinamide adenine dinucleotide transporter SLC25A51-like n=1 Tax=Styela clava TaxID=7725 RepID=UPI00193A2DDB|nr:mitochondrial nicotinamide adenine dinucleotide transporter SLC25A51-like [Styela clava]